MNTNKYLVVPIYGMVFLAILTTPALFMGVFDMSSMAVGAGLISLSCILISIIYLPNYIQTKKIVKTSTLISFAVLMLIQSISGCCADNFDYQRYLGSLILLIIYFLGSFCFVKFTQKINNDIADSAVFFVFCVMLISGIFGVLKYSPFYNELATKAVFFYSEPSHFSLNFLPLLLYMTVRSTLNIKMLLLISAILIALKLENLTLLLGIFLILIISLPFRAIVYILFFGFVSLSFLDVNYYFDRLNFSEDNSNLSVLVYMQGWERAYLNFLDTFGLGVGFQQFGIVGNLGDISDKIEFLSGERLNVFDGGSVGSKLIGEFGVIGLIMILLYIKYFFRFVKTLHLHSISKDFKTVLCLSIFIMYSIDLFVRGTGYFSSSGFLFLASTIWLYINGKFNTPFPRNFRRPNLDA